MIRSCLRCGHAITKRYRQTRHNTPRYCRACKDKPAWDAIEAVPLDEVMRRMEEAKR